jgi:ElaB/YqjD/DUF883 family membrane-anchored ribosome-binding protein
MKLSRENAMSMNKPMEAASAKLVQDLRAVIADAEALLEITAGQGGEQVEKVRARVEQSVRSARERLLAAGHDLDGSVRDNAWTALGVAAGVGLVLGVMLGRK